MYGSRIAVTQRIFSLVVRGGGDNFHEGMRMLPRIYDEPLKVSNSPRIYDEPLKLSNSPAFNCV